MVGATRKSTRKRVKNTRYANDILENIGEDFGEVFQSGSENSPPPPPADDDSGKDETFDQELVQPESDDEYGLLEEEVGNAANEEHLSDGSEVMTPDEDGDRIDDLGIGNVDRRRRAKKPDKLESRSRGLAAYTNSVALDIATIELAGRDTKDLEPIVREREKWLDHVSLPSRLMTKHGTGGLDYPFVYTKEMRDTETESFMKWYFRDGGQEEMEGAENVIVLDANAAKAYVPDIDSSHNIFLGPYGNQKLFEIAAADPLSLREAWAEAEEKLDPVQRKPPESRNGWLLNLGDKIRALDWAPNHDGDTQYLAISTVSNPPADHPRCTAFEPVQPYKASISIWAIKSKKEDEMRVIDMSVKPEAVLVACTDWGAVRRLQWCPSARPDDGEEASSRSIGLLGGIWTDGYVRVLDIRIPPAGFTKGRLVKYQAAAFACKPPDTICTCLSWLSATSIAVGCANGFVAVWNVAKHILSLKNSHLSPNSLLASAPANQPRATPPLFYHPIHITYILSINAHFPFPTSYITTSSADGRVRLTSLAHPLSDTATSTRTRNTISALTYSPHILSVITPDDNDVVRSLPLRQFFGTKNIARTSAQVTCLDAGKMHPCLLIGSADGTVMLTNPMRRLFVRKDRNAAAWQQVWFRSEWRPDPPEEEEAPAQALTQQEDGVVGIGQQLEQLPDEQTQAQAQDGPHEVGASSHQPPPLSQTHSSPYLHSTPLTSNLPSIPVPSIHPPPIRPGTSRHLESFKLQSVPLVRNLYQSVRPFMNRKDFKRHYNIKSAEKEAEGLAYDTIFEEESAVTAVSWNGNAGVGGWAAAGLGNGIVRVEDLGI